MPPPQKHKLLFWIILAAFSTFFAEVFSGSNMFPFFHPWGILVVTPLYGLHTLILLTLIYRYGGRPTFPALVFAGMLFGLYEAYVTKMLWRPAWEAWLTLGDVAVFEVFVLLWWHTWLSFITPTVLVEGLLTASRHLLIALPRGLRRFYGSWKGWLAIALFGALFQSTNSPNPTHSLLSGLSTVASLALLTALWERLTRGRAYALPDLLPNPKEFRFLALWLGALYIFHTFAVTPERIPSFWPGQAVIWGLYALAITLLVRALRRSRRKPLTNSRRKPPFPSPRALLGAGALLILALPLAKALLSGAALVVVLSGWGAGVVLGVWAFILAVGRVITKSKRQKWGDDIITAWEER